MKKYQQEKDAESMNEIRRKAFRCALFGTERAPIKTKLKQVKTR